jgi:hypothetical protein
MALGRIVLTDVRDVNGDDYTGRNNGSPVAAAVVVGEDAVGGTVNLRILLDGVNSLYQQNVPVGNVEAVNATASK